MLMEMVICIDNVIFLTVKAYLDAKAPKVIFARKLLHHQAKVQRSGALSVIANSRDQDFGKVMIQSSPPPCLCTCILLRDTAHSVFLRFSRYVSIGSPVSTSSDIDFEVASQTLEYSTFPQHNGPVAEIKNVEEQRGKMGSCYRRCILLQYKHYLC
jgi:hypothetical protein